METLNDILSFELFRYKEKSFTVFELAGVLAVFIITKIVLWFIKNALNKKNRFHKLDKGSSFALFQLIKYNLWIIAFVFTLEIIGFKITILLAGSAALLVGVGLGLQQTFNDIISGIILLFEQFVKVDDILEIELIQGRLIGFGNSSLNFQILFYSQNIFHIDKVKSEIRKIIVKKFMANNIVIPFPQMDINIKPHNKLFSYLSIKLQPQRI